MKSSVSFRIVAIPVDSFAPLFSLSDAELAERGVRRYVADKQPGFPCRVSLVDAEPGERVILVPFVHHAADSPYRSSGPIFVREGARQATPEVGEVPESVRRRLLSIRAYDASGLMVDAEVAEGQELERHVERFLTNPHRGLSAPAQCSARLLQLPCRSGVKATASRADGFLLRRRIAKMTK